MLNRLCTALIPASKTISDIYGSGGVGRGGEGIKILRRKEVCLLSSKRCCDSGDPQDQFFCNKFSLLLYSRVLKSAQNCASFGALCGKRIFF
jgi:hypothetical protein